MQYLKWLQASLTDGFPTLARYPLLLAAGLAVAACTSLPRQMPDSEAAVAEQALEVQTEAQQDNASQPVPETEAEIEYGHFSRDQLTQAIMGELGGLRGDLPGASRDYYELARETGDIGIIRRAIQFAIVSGDSETAIELASFWISLDPDDVTPHLMLAYRYLDTGRPDLSAQYMESALALGGEVDFTDISNRTQDLPGPQRLAVQQALTGLHDRYPEDRSLHLALIQLMSQNSQNEQALAELQQLREQFGDSVRVVFIEAQLLQNLDREEDALAAFRKGTGDYPRSRVLRMGYAQALIQGGELDAALAEFQALVDQAPDDYESRFSMALLYMEMEEHEQARLLFEELLTVGFRNNDAHFYLGYLFKAENSPEQAIRHFSQVQQDSANFLNAQGQIILLLVTDGRYADAHDWTTQLTAGNPRLEIVLRTVEADALASQNALDLAMDVLNGVIEKYPDNVDLLFNRTLMHERRGDMAAAEADLQRIIALEPDNAQALNHLGYTLADQTDRHQEALALIERAIAISPDDPAIIDSLGWAQYKLGLLDAAASNLRRAYAVFPDHEVAAHLGEVLWVSGETAEARQIWEEALERRPDSELLRNVMQRFEVNT